MEKLLPVDYFLVTCTLPHTRNPIARSNQQLIYDLLFKTSSDALQTLTLNLDWLGGKIGMVGALHTWSRSMGYHLHVHYLVPAGGIDPTTGEWRSSHSKFLVPASALREVFRAKFRDALEEADPDLFAQVPPTTWAKNWVVHCKPVGDGRTALKYLAPYIYRVALSNRRLVKMEDGTVTFRYKPRKKPWRTMTLDALTFMQRFLQHVLPKGFQKVRYVGFLHPSAKKTFSALQEQFPSPEPEMKQKPETEAEKETESESQSEPSLRLREGLLDPSTTVTETSICCPHCGGPLAYIGRVPPHKDRRGPP
jgi:hypothetical protein